jgi:hypothetical protein
MKSASYVKWAFGLFGYKPIPDDLDREIFVTPFNGAYGIAGHIITIEGSPPRTTVAVLRGTQDMIAFYQGRIVRGSMLASKAAMLRYEQAVGWLTELGRENP